MLFLTFLFAEMRREKVFERYEDFNTCKRLLSLPSIGLDGRKKRLIEANNKRERELREKAILCLLLLLFGDGDSISTSEVGSGWIEWRCVSCFSFSIFFIISTCFAFFVSLHSLLRMRRKLADDDYSASVLIVGKLSLIIISFRRRLKKNNKRREN